MFVFFFFFFFFLFSFFFFFLVSTAGDFFFLKKMSMLPSGNQLVRINSKELTRFSVTNIMYRGNLLKDLEAGYASFDHK